MKCVEVKVLSWKRHWWTWLPLWMGLRLPLQFGGLLCNPPRPWTWGGLFRLGPGSKHLTGSQYRYIEEVSNQTDMTVNSSEASMTQS